MAEAMPDTRSSNTPELARAKSADLKWANLKWAGPFLMDSQLTDEERMIRKSACSLSA